MQYNQSTMIDAHSQIAQRQLYFHYKHLMQNSFALPRFEDTGFRVFSQNDEDGLLLYIFSLIGFSNKVCIDIAFGYAYGANTTNLLLNWNFHGLLVENKNIEGCKLFFSKNLDTHIFPPIIVKEWVTAENINSLCDKNGFSGEIDLFSLDVDGVDYWLWEALEVVSPRVVVVEYNDILGHNLSLTVPYEEKFDRFKIHEDFCGASLLAFVKLAKKKGYRLVGTNKYQFNAFFIRNDIGIDLLPEVDYQDCFTHPKVIWGMKERYPNVKELNWQEV